MDAVTIGNAITERWNCLSKDERIALDFLGHCDTENSFENNLYEEGLKRVPEYDEDRMEWLNNDPEAKGFMEEVICDRLMDLKNYTFGNHISYAMIEQYKHNVGSHLTSEVFEVFMLQMAENAGIKQVTQAQLHDLYVLSSAGYYFIDELKGNMKSIFFPEE